MSDEEIRAVSRAAEAGYFRDDHEAWLSERAGSTREAKIERAILEKVEGFLGRKIECAEEGSFERRGFPLAILPRTFR